MILTQFLGSKKAFAAGADIKGMLTQNYAENLRDFQNHWISIAKVRKPIVAAVNGYVLGGGKKV